MTETQKALKGKILVTGAGGLIGSAIIWHLNQLGYAGEIIACDWMPDKDDRWKNLVPLRFGDYIDAKALKFCMHDKEFAPRLEGLGTIFHVGAISSTRAGGFMLYDWNYEYTRGLLGRYAENPDVRVVYASSAATYGSSSSHFSDDHELLHGLRQDNLYGWYKHRVDMHALERGWLDRVTCLKFFNVYGQNEHHKDQQSLVYRAACEIRDKAHWVKIRLYRPEVMARDFIYVKDAAAAAIHLASGSHPGVYNVGSGLAHSWKWMAKEVCAVLHKDPDHIIKWIDLPPEMVARGYQMHTEANTRKLLAAGFQRKFFGAVGVADCVAGIFDGKRLGE